MTLYAKPLTLAQLAATLRPMYRTRQPNSPQLVYIGEVVLDMKTAVFISGDSHV